MILDSTLVTLCISLGCVFLGVLVFTRSTHLSLIVMLVVMMIVLGLLFFMVIAGPLLRCVVRALHCVIILFGGHHVAPSWPSCAEIMSWKIGAIEVLSLIVFVGFAVDYCLHLSRPFLP